MENINTQLVEVIFSLSRLMKGQMASHSEFFFLSFLQVQTLIFVAKNKKVQMSDIANNFTIELPSATSLVQTLVKDGLVERTADKKDRRVVNVALTLDGKKLLKKAMRERTKRITKNMSILSELEKKQLLKILKKMILKMEEENEK